MITPTIHLHLLPAQAAPRILIIRRGPTRVYHLVLWDTERDSFERGSWSRGALCDAGIAYPTEGFSEIYPREGSWADIPAVLRS